eukprot:8272652-Ditylum_brightwellii.AAC.1
MEHGPDRGYFPEPDKSIHVCDSAEDTEKAREAFDAAGLKVNLHDGFRYVRGFIGGQEQEVEYTTPKVREWAAGVKTLAGIAKRYPQTAYAGFTMSLQAEWQYLQQTVPNVGKHMGAIEDALQDDFIPALFGGRPPPGMRE